MLASHAADRSGAPGERPRRRRADVHVGNHRRAEGRTDDSPQPRRRVPRADVWEFDSPSVSLTPLPMFHIGGIGWAFVGLWNGATTILVRDFDAAAVLDPLERERVTNAVFVPTMLQMLCCRSRRAARDFSSLRSIAYGASPITTTVLKAALRTFRCSLFGIYGLTETTGAITQLDPSDHEPDGAREHLLRSAGNRYPWVEMRIADPATGAALPAARGRRGLAARAERHAGYFNRPAETAAALTADGWLRTGDGGYLDEDGYLFLTDRIKDMIVSGGENVYPIEVEEALSQHPGCARGGRDRRSGRALGRNRQGARSSGGRLRRSGPTSWSRSPASASPATSCRADRVRATSFHGRPPERCSSATCARVTCRSPTLGRRTRSRRRVREQEADQFPGGVGHIGGERVGAVLQGDELCSRDRACQKSTVFERQDPIVFAVHDERWSCDRSQSRAHVRVHGRSSAGCDRSADRGNCSDAGRCPRRSATRAGGRSSPRRDMAPSPTGPPQRGGRRAGARTGGSAVPVRRTACRRPWMSRGRASERAPDGGLRSPERSHRRRKDRRCVRGRRLRHRAGPRRLQPSSRRAPRSRESAPRAGGQPGAPPPP